MRDKSTAQLRARQRRLVTRLRTLTPHVLRGSLITRYTRCGRPRCACVQGQGHGPKYYLSVSSAGKRPEMVYVPQDSVPQVRQGLAQLQEFRAVLEELCALRHELLKRRATR
jgi:Family of unknown function (DUF6788)